MVYKGLINYFLKYVRLKLFIYYNNNKSYFDNIGDQNFKNKN